MCFYVGLALRWARHRRQDTGAHGETAATTSLSGIDADAARRRALKQYSTRPVHSGSHYTHQHGVELHNVQRFYS